MEILNTGMVMIGIAALCVLLIFRLSPEACGTVASILLSRAAAHRASRKVYQQSRAATPVLCARSIQEDAVLAALSSPQTPEAAALAFVLYERAALRAGER